MAKKEKQNEWVFGLLGASLILLMIVIGIQNSEKSKIYSEGYTDGIEQSIHIIKCVYKENRTEEECINEYKDNTKYMEYLISESWRLR